MKIRTLIVLFFAWFWVSCKIFDVRSSFEPPTGWLYQETVFNHSYSPKSELGSRQGKACVVSYLSLYTVGDASIRTAASIAGIKEIRAIDYEVYRFLGFVYEEFCLIVHGE
ncbi:MAG: TRL-like family protein [Leptospiraceae bacterium]|nr:TRL-like family protein [Leptospiraceae bacterium]MDW7975062.1 TRL-like family protein [Leptospiraceae bacterium]